MEKGGMSHLNISEVATGRTAQKRTMRVTIDTREPWPHPWAGPSAGWVHH